MTCHSSPHRDRPPEARPLPTSLTRFLAHPGARIVEPPRDGRARCGPSVPTTANAAIKITVGWAVLYNVVGFAILWWLWSTMG